MARNIDNPLLWHQAVDIFENQTMPRLRLVEATQTDNPDWPLRRETWNNWVDSLCKDKQISDWQQHNWTHPPSTG